MSEVVVHGVPGSPYVRAVLLTLAEKGAPHRLAAMGMNEALTPEHLARQPFGRIPVIDHGDFQLYETQAILRYLDVVFPKPSLRPVEPRAAARVDQICGIVDWYLFPQASATIGWQRVIVPMIGGTPDEAVVAASVPKARVVFATLNGLLGEQPFLAGESLSIADLMTAPHLDFLEQTPEGAALLAGTRLLDWLGRMRERPSLMATTMERLRQAA